MKWQHLEIWSKWKVCVDHIGELKLNRWVVCLIWSLKQSLKFVDFEWMCNPAWAYPQWGAVDTEIKVPFGENTELKRFLFKTWSRSVYSDICYTFCQGFLLCLFLPFRSIHLHFFQNRSWFFPALAVANTGSCVGPHNKVGHCTGCRFPCLVLTEY